MMLMRCQRDGRFLPVSAASTEFEADDGAEAHRVIRFERFAHDHTDRLAVFVEDNVHEMPERGIRNREHDECNKAATDHPRTPFLSRTLGGRDSLVAVAL